MTFTSSSKNYPSYGLTEVRKLIIYMRKKIYIHIYRYIYIYTYTAHIYIYLYTVVFIYSIYLYIYLVYIPCVYIHICIYIHIFTYIYTCTSMCINTHWVYAPSLQFGWALCERCGTISLWVKLITSVIWALWCEHLDFLKVCEAT